MGYPPPLIKHWKYSNPLGLDPTTGNIYIYLIITRTKVQLFRELNTFTLDQYLPLSVPLSINGTEFRHIRQFYRNGYFIMNLAQCSLLYFIILHYQRRDIFNIPYIYIYY